METAPPLKCPVKKSVRIFEVGCSTQVSAELVFETGFIIFRSVTSFSESSEVVVITVFRASEFISIQVNRLTGARTRMKLMIGAELGSSH
ncbi:hypothetical protein QL285_015100 [Trifolium repens]|nr:hypothetical protein QL285_048132 [Trifolium repens]KAK2413001.1 hypothetical protein QL285_048133 [Trifolium repens]KAK2444045.1 hypothetical protein QL285_015100 [Trifolium repens]